MSAFPAWTSIATTGDPDGVGGGFNDGDTHKSATDKINTFMLALAAFFSLDCPVLLADRDITWAVGTDYATIEEASKAALGYVPVNGRTLEIQVPAGTYVDDFPVPHPSRNVKYVGAALTGAFPVKADFQVTAFAVGAARNADLAAQETMLRSRYSVVLECTTGDALKLEGKNLNMSNVAIINTGTAQRGINLGGDNISFESGNGSFFAGDQISIHGFDNANVSTEYGGHAVFTDDKFTTSGSERGVQLQYGGGVFAIGAAVISNSIYGARYKRIGLGYFDGGDFAGNGADVSMTQGGTHHGPNTTHENSNRILTIIGGGEADMRGGTGTSASTFVITLTGLFDVNLDNFTLTMTAGNTGIQGQGNGYLSGDGLSISGAASSGVSNEGGHFNLQNSTFDSNGVNVLHRHGLTDLTGATLTNPTGGIGGVTADVFLFAKSTGQVLGTAVGTPVVVHRNSNNTAVGAVNTMADTGSVYVI